MFIKSIMFYYDYKQFNFDICLIFLTFKMSVSKFIGKRIIH